MPSATAEKAISAIFAAPVISFIELKLSLWHVAPILAICTTRKVGCAAQRGIRPAGVASLMPRIALVAGETNRPLHTSAKFRLPDRSTHVDLLSISEIRAVASASLPETGENCRLITSDGSPSFLLPVAR